MAGIGQVPGESTRVPTWVQVALDLGKLTENPMTAPLVASVRAVFAGEPEDAGRVKKLRSGHGAHDARMSIACEVWCRLRGGKLPGERSRAAFLTLGMLAALETGDMPDLRRALIERPRECRMYPGREDVRHTQGRAWFRTLAWATSSRRAVDVDVLVFLRDVRDGVGSRAAVALLARGGELLPRLPLSVPQPAGTSEPTLAAASGSPFRARRLLVYRASLGTGSGTPRENGRVDVEWLGEGDQRRSGKISRKQLEEFRHLAHGGFLFRPEADTDKARDRSRRRAGRLVKRCQEFGIPVEDTRGTDGHRVILGGRFDVREIEGPADVTAEAKRLLREAQGDVYRDQARE